MNKMIVILMTTILSTCSEKTENKTIWVNSYKTDCVGVGPMKCMLVKTEKDADWTNFYQKIEGFDYQPGYKYELEVKVDTLDKATLPADASSLRYTLVNEVSKEVDRSLRVNDIWVLEKIAGVELDSLRPQMEINVAKSKLSGKGFCNRIMGSVKKLTDTELEFGEILSTRMACPAMDKEAKYTEALNNTKFYNLENNRLTLLSVEKNELLVYKKID
jgi:heat shock protein HslJ